MKNLSCIIAPASKREGINPKSLPLLIFDALVNYSFGSAQSA
jgi:hypothetical protein